MFEERRSFSRINLMAQVRLGSDQEGNLLEVANLSRSGVFVLTEQPKDLKGVSIGQEVDLDIVVPGNQVDIHVKGLIVRIEDTANQLDNGFAISFTFAEPQAQMNIRRLIETCDRKTGEPPKLPFPGTQ